MAFPSASWMDLADIARSTGVYWRTGGWGIKAMRSEDEDGDGNGGDEVELKKGKKKRKQDN